MIVPLTNSDRAFLRRADPSVVVNALSRFRSHVCPPWLPSGHPYPDGVLPNGAGFAAVSDADVLEIVAVRGPLHAIDGWSYLGRAISSLLSGQAHAARHLAYYAELRAALSILASSGIGIFNRKNVVIDAAGQVHAMSERPTHEMAWLALEEWSALSSSIKRLISPIRLAGTSIHDLFQEFFPGPVLAVASKLMGNWGFDLQQGMIDRDQRNWSSYQPTALGPIQTNPAEDASFLTMFWNACRPNGVEIERHLLRILLETEATQHNSHVSDYAHIYGRLNIGTKMIVSLDFLSRVNEPVDHEFIIKLANTASPAPPYSMICRAGLLLRLATGMAEENLRNAGVQPVVQFSQWWEEFGASHGLWPPNMPPVATADLWEDIDFALEESNQAPTGNRYEWISALGSRAMRMCEAERAVLWGLFQ